MTLSRSEINSLKQKALSSDEVERAIDGKARIMSYPQLDNYDSIEKAWGKDKAIILLYETSDSFGHWVLVMKTSKGIEVFDSYGSSIGKPDDELKIIPKKFRKESNQDYPHLTKLLYQSGLPVEYNEKRLQKDGSKIATCGRHCIVRLLTRDMPLAEYQKRITSNKKYNPDDLVTIATADV